MMRNFGINLAATVQSVIGKQEYQILEWLSRGRGPNGDDVDVYADPVTRHASIQPLDIKEAVKRNYALNSYYIDVFDTSLIETLTRTNNPDKFIFDGYYWIPQGPAQDWSQQGGWQRVTMIRQGKA